MKDVIELTDEFQRNIQWWLEFLPKWNGSASSIELNWSKPDILHLFTDAAGKPDWAHFIMVSGSRHGGRFGLPEGNPPIEYLEFIPILLALLTWKNQLSKKQIVLPCDNQGVVQAWRKLGFTHSVVLEIMRRIFTVSALHNFTICIKHIAGVKNEIADALSRFQMARFQLLAPHALTLPDHIPKTLADLVSPKSKPSSESLKHTARALERCHIANSTRNSYETGVRQFSIFCQANQLCQLPAFAETVRLFLASLFREDLSLSTMKVYLTGVGNDHTEANLSNPINSHAVHRQLTGVKRRSSLSKQPDLRHPVTLHLMRQLKTRLAESDDIPSHDKLMCWCAFTVAFGGAVRVSRFASQSSTSFNANRTPRAKDLTLRDTFLEIKIRSSKTTKLASAVNSSWRKQEGSGAP